VRIVLKDSVFEPSNAWRHAAEILPALQEANTDGELQCVAFRSDGGGDHNNTHLTTQYSLIALWRKTGVDCMISYRPASDNSFDNECEGVMPVLNLTLQHQSTERAAMQQVHEELIRSADSMSAIRAAVAAETGRDTDRVYSRRGASQCGAIRLSRVLAGVCQSSSTLGNRCVWIVLCIHSLADRIVHPLFGRSYCASTFGRSYCASTLWPIVLCIRSLADRIVLYLFAVLFIYSRGVSICCVYSLCVFVSLCLLSVCI
jgi:hypothetical protein